MIKPTIKQLETTSLILTAISAAIELTSFIRRKLKERKARNEAINKGRI